MIHNEKNQSTEMEPELTPTLKLTKDIRKVIIITFCILKKLEARGKVEYVK